MKHGFTDNRVQRAAPWRRSGRAGRRPAARRPAFTIVELIVVITVIILILAIGVPALSRMNADARLSAAQQQLNSALSRAYFLALSDRTLTALRFLPADWDTPDPNRPLQGGRQHALIYSYVGTSIREVPPGSGNYSANIAEYFTRARDTNPLVLPPDTWAAPAEALVTKGAWARTNGTMQTTNTLGTGLVLPGKIGTFALNAVPGGTDSGNLLNADDFLIVCDWNGGIRYGPPRPYPVRAYVPNVTGAPGGYAGFENEGQPFTGGNQGSGNSYQRFAFTGILLYRREPFIALEKENGSANDALARQEYLRRTARPLLASRFSGGLRLGAQNPE